MRSGPSYLRLTETSIAKIDPGEKQEVYVRDDKLTGFAVRARRMAGGNIKRTFLVVHQERKGASRKTIKAFIGDWKDPWSEGEARSEATKMLALKDMGNPLLSPKKRRKSERTCDDLVAEFKIVHLVTLKANSASEYDRLLQTKFSPQFGGQSVSSITRTDLRDWHASMRNAPYAANRALAVASKLFAFAVERGWRSDNPCIGIKKNKEKAREVWLDEYDLQPFLTELNAHQTAHHELLKFLTVTGWRVREAINLRWDMIDLRRMIAKLPDTKTGEQVRVLSSDATTLIDRQVHRIGYVFSGKNGMQPVGYKQTRLMLADVCKEAGINIISPHALRHTAATYAAINGASVLELKDALGWKSTAMAERYVEKADAIARQGAEKAAAGINLFGKPTAKIIDLSGE
jgi:integrase